MKAGMIQPTLLRHQEMHQRQQLLHIILQRRPRNQQLTRRMERPQRLIQLTLRILQPMRLIHRQRLPPNIPQHRRIPQNQLVRRQQRLPF